MSKRNFPVVVRNGNVRVKIYETPSHGCTSYTVSYYFGGKRQRRTFASLDLAEQEARIVATKIAAGQLDVLSLTSADRTAYVRSMDILRELKTPLELAVMQFAEANRILKGASLVEASKFYAKHHGSNVVARMVADVVLEFVEAKRKDGLSAVYCGDLESRLTPFGAKFGCPVNMVLGSEIQDYLRDLKCGPRSKNNTRKSIRTLFAFAQGRGYLPKGDTEASAIQRAKEPGRSIGIFTPDAMASMLKLADEELVAFLAIGAFAGLRRAEILRLDWSEVDLADGHIEVKAKKAKTGSRRLVPISENLKLWLGGVREREGKIFGRSEPMLTQMVSALAKKAGVKWVQNGLRHSYISYRVAQVQNVAQVALEAGNSPQIIFSNYRELVKPKQAELWFSIVPPGVIVPPKANAEPAQSNIVPMPAVAV